VPEFPPRCTCVGTSGIGRQQTLTVVAAAMRAWQFRIQLPMRAPSSHFRCVCAASHAGVVLRTVWSCPTLLALFLFRAGSHADTHALPLTHCICVVLVFLFP